MILGFVLHFPPFGIFFNLFAGPPISHSEKFIMWLIERTVLVLGVKRGRSESLGYSNSLRAPFHYQQNLGWVEAGFANLPLFCSSPVIRHEKFVLRRHIKWIFLFIATPWIQSLKFIPVYLKLPIIPILISLL